MPQVADGRREVSADNAGVGGLYNCANENSTFASFALIAAVFERCCHFATVA